MKLPCTMPEESLIQPVVTARPPVKKKPASDPKSDVPKVEASKIKAQTETAAKALKETKSKGDAAVKDAPEETAL
jgi:hypothetical protein